MLTASVLLVFVTYLLKELTEERVTHAKVNKAKMLRVYSVSSNVIKAA